MSEARALLLDALAEMGSLYPEGLLADIAATPSGAELIRRADRPEPRVALEGLTVEMLAKALPIAAMRVGSPWPVFTLPIRCAEAVLAELRALPAPRPPEPGCAKCGEPASNLVHTLHGRLKTLSTHPFAPRQPEHGPDGNEGYCRCGSFVGHDGWSEHLPAPRPDRTAALDEERLANALRIAVDADQHTDLVYSGVVSVEAHRESFARRVAKAYAALAPTPDEAP
jgi:hypothetical protein